MNDTNKPENEINESITQTGGGSAGSSCEPGCKCNAAPGGNSRKLKLLVLVVIIIAAIAVAARSLIRQSNNPGKADQKQFAAVLPQDKSEAPAVKTPSPDATVDTQANKSNAAETAAPEKADWGEPLSSVTALNDVAADVDAVFILLSNEQNKSSDPAVKEMESAATTIKARGIRIRSFYLKKEAPEYQSFSQQVSVPGVVVLVKGRGMNAVQAGQITADRLLQAFVAASQPSGCGPSSSCGPKSVCK